MADTILGCRKFFEANSNIVGLVPTMGYLHDGHISLVRRARDENEVVAVSIFVNPAQFGPAEDFEDYPRDMDSDLRLLESENVDFVFAPSVGEMYPEGFMTYIDVGDVAKRLEGEHRPGHFRGVATVVCKLLMICKPQRAYFGQKDAQQCAVLKKLNLDLNLGCEIKVSPTVRDRSGLALSSRNAYLSSDEYKVALLVNQGLFRAKTLWESGNTDAGELICSAREIMESSPYISVEYLSLVQPETFVEIDEATEGSLLCVAIRLGETRLIDTVIFTF